MVDFAMQQFRHSHFGAQCVDSASCCSDSVRAVMAAACQAF